MTNLIAKAAKAIECLDSLRFDQMPWDAMFAANAVNLLTEIKTGLESLKANPPSVEYGPGVLAVAEALRSRFDDMPMGSKGLADVFLDCGDVAGMLAEVKEAKK